MPGYYFFHRKSNHIFTIWQHLSLLTIIRQYEGKSYRMFTEWLIEAHYLRTFLKISRRTPHFTTLQKFTDRIAGTILERKNNLFFHCPSSYQCQADILWNRFVWIQVNPFITVLHRKTKLRRKWIKLSIGDDVLKQIICTIKIRGAPTKHDNIDFKSIIITRTSDRH